MIALILIENKTRDQRSQAVAQITHPAVGGEGGGAWNTLIIFGRWCAADSRNGYPILDRV